MSSSCFKYPHEAWIAQREAETGLPDPIYDQGDWHGHTGVGSFTSSQQAYDVLHIGDPNQAVSPGQTRRKVLPEAI